MMTEDVYHTSNENDFIKKYIDATRTSDLTIDKKLMFDRENFVLLYPYLPNPMFSTFYNNLYNSFKFIYEIEIILDEILYEGLTLNRAETLMNLCILLSSVSTNAMIFIDNDFSLEKKYSLAKDVYIMAKNIYDSLMLIYTASADDLSFDDVLTLTNYDELESRLSCKYIRNGIAVLKLFHILAILQISPLCDDGVHKIAKKLIQSLREVLFDKRIIKLVVDTDIYALSKKAHKTTRIKIYFAMSNSDRYCIRLDFPHEGEETIHLNLNEPAHKQSTGFPFNGEEYKKAVGICKGKSLFNELFYYRDDLYWFRSNFTTTIKQIGKSNNVQEQELKEFQHKRGHMALFPPDKDNIKSVADFSAAFAEAMIEYEEESVYGITDSEDDKLYQYVLFQDYIYDTIIRIKSKEMYNIIVLGDERYQLYTDSTNQIKLKSVFCKYIKEKFPYDEKLNNITDNDMSFCEFISKCLDCIDQFGV